jgi:hypothetical protein
MLTHSTAHIRPANAVLYDKWHHWKTARVVYRFSLWGGVSVSVRRGSSATTIGTLVCETRARLKRKARLWHFSLSLRQCDLFSKRFLTSSFMLQTILKHVLSFPRFESNVFEQQPHKHYSSQWLSYAVLSDAHTNDGYTNTDWLTVAIKCYRKTTIA